MALVSGVLTIKIEGKYYNSTKISLWLYNLFLLVKYSVLSENKKILFQFSRP